MELLSRDMQYTLGCMAEWDDDSLIGHTLDSLPVGTRMALQTYGAVEESGDSEYSLRFTRFGRRVAWACFKKLEGYIRFRNAELEEAQARRDAAELPEELQQTLAMLAYADDADAEITLILLPVGDKQLLGDRDAVQLRWEDDICYVKLTTKGRRLMNACAILQAPDWQKKKVQEFEEARRDYWEGQIKSQRLSRFVTRPGDLHRRK